MQSPRHPPCTPRIAAMRNERLIVRRNMAHDRRIGVVPIVNSQRLGQG